MTIPSTTPRAPVETKTKAATGATFVAGLALWVLSKYVFKGNAVPDVLQSWIYAAAPAVITFIAAYRAPHTPRPDLPPLSPLQPLWPPVQLPTAPAVEVIPTLPPEPTL